MTFALRLLKPAEVSFADARVFRVSAGAVAAITACMGIIVVACIGVGWRGGILLGNHGAIPALLAWWVAFWLGLFFVFYANDWRKTLSRGAWLALAAADGVHIKYRSYRNVVWGNNDPQVVFVPYAAIARARIDRRAWLTPETQTRATRTARCTYVELDLVGVDLAELTQRLADERAGKPGRSTRGTKIWRHFPVSVEPGDVLRIEWRARPSATVFMECLATYGVKIEAQVATTADLGQNPSQERIHELARRGDVIELVRVLRHNSDMTLTEARAEAERLITQGGPEQDPKG